MEKRFNPLWHKKSLAQEISSVFHKRNYAVYLVGGAVRSLLLKGDPYDLDFTTNATPVQVMEFFLKTIPTGIKHGTVTIIWKREPVEVTTFRHEGSYSDARHPDEISYISSLKEDLSRRDFTMNALAYNVLEGKLFDYFEGEADIKKKIIRAIGEPEKRFKEDALRILRGSRFASELGFQIEEKTLSAMKKLSPSLLKLSAERIYKEFKRTLTGEFPLLGLKLLQEIGFFSLFSQEEPSTVSWEGLSLLPVGETGFLSRLILFSLSLKTEERLPFFKALKFPNLPKEKVMHLSALLENQASRFDDKEARIFLNELGRENLSVYLEIQKVRSSSEDFKSLKEILKRNSVYPLNIKELALTGNDFLAKGMQGKKIGESLKTALGLVLENPNLNEKESLLRILGI